MHAHRLNRKACLGKTSQAFLRLFSVINAVFRLEQAYPSNSEHPWLYEI